MVTHSVETRVAVLEGTADRLTKTLEAVSKSLDQLVRVEMLHAETREALTRAFKQLDAQNERISVVEHAMPQLKETRGWVITGVLGIVALVGIAAMHLLVTVPTTSRQPVQTYAHP